jgi:hypothetical protein
MQAIPLSLAVAADQIGTVDFQTFFNTADRCALLVREEYGGETTHSINSRAKGSQWRIFLDRAAADDD